MPNCPMIPGPGYLSCGQDHRDGSELFLTSVDPFTKDGYCIKAPTSLGAHLQSVQINISNEHALLCCQPGIEGQPIYVVTSDAILKSYFMPYQFPMSNYDATCFQEEILLWPAVMVLWGKTWNMA